MFVVAEVPREAPVVNQAGGQVPNPAPSDPAIDLPILLAVLAGIAVLSGIGATLARAGRIEPRSTRS